MTSDVCLIVNDLQFAILDMQWASLARSYMEEERWYHSGYKPRLDEYMNNAKTSIATPVMTVHSHIFGTEPAAQAELEYIKIIGIS